MRCFAFLVEKYHSIKYNTRMPNDMYTLKALTDELSSITLGGRIEKINQPEKDEFTFYIHKNKTVIMVVSVNPNCPRIHITDEKKDNPYVAPAFLMLLRKKLIGARIEDFSIIGYDRIIKISFKGKNEMADEVSNTLYIELLGRYSNIILCDESGIIIEALRHIYPENSFRCILPKIKYELPPNDKLIPTDTKGIINALLNNTKDNIAKKIISAISGFSTITATELCIKINIDPDSIDINHEQAGKIANAINDLYSISSSEDFAPCFVLNENNEDFYVYPYTHLNQTVTSVDSLNTAVKLCSQERDRRTRLANESKIISNAIKNAIKKAEKALGIAKQKVMDSKDSDSLRKIGEIITNSLYLLKKGDKKADLYDYYEDKTITITLDPMLSPEQNAQSYFKRYSKAKRTLSIATEQVKELEKKLDYLYSLKAHLEVCSIASEVTGIKEEAISSGILEDKTKKDKRSKKSLALPPKQYTIQGFTIYRGRNNIDNEQITFKMSSEKDIWLHVKDLHGSHVLIKNNGCVIPSEIIQAAAEIAAFYSEGKQTHKIAVDYCEKKFVKKNPSGVKGAVIYTNFKTAYVTPKEHREDESNK